MMGLLVKDFRLLRQRIRFFAILVLVAVFMTATGNKDNTFVITYLTLVTALFSISSISYDEYDNCYCFLMTLPLDRKTYTIEKYLFGVILGLAAWVVGAVIYGVSVLARGQMAELGSDLMESLVYIPLFMILLSLTIPFVLKYGAERGRLAMLVVFGAVAAAIFVLAKLTNSADMVFRRLMVRTQGISGGELLLGCFLAGVVVTVISLMISIRIMEKKEL